MSGWARLYVGLATLVLTLSAAAQGRYGLGTVPTPEEIAGWDIDIRPDGRGLPPGQGTALDGEDVYVERCASCHGEFGEAVGRYPVLMGGEGSLASEEPVKTVGSYWPYASTVFDYVRRAMPFGHAQSLTDDETYAITAYLLNLNDIVEDDFVLNADTLPSVEMPNRNGFIQDDRPDVPTGEPCMSDCRGSFEVIGKARVIDVTPEDAKGDAGTDTDTDTVVASTDTSEATLPGDPASGKRVFVQCSACHSLNPDEHRIGPTLHGIVARAAGTAGGFDRYSEAMKGSGVVWDVDTLRQYLAAPQEFIAGTTMPFFGVKDEEQLDDLIAYLLTESGAE